MKKAQIAAEVVAYIGFFLILLITISFYVFNAFNLELKNQQYLRAKAAAEQVANNFLLVVNAGPGTTLNFSVPKSLFSSAAVQSDYYILISNNGWVYIVYQSTTSAEPMFSYPAGFRNFSCKVSPISSCIKISNYLNISPARGWIVLNYTKNSIEVE